MKKSFQRIALTFVASSFLSCLPLDHQKVAAVDLDPELGVDWGPSRIPVPAGNSSVSISEASPTEQLRFSNSLAPCEISPSVDCISSIEVESSGSWQVASYLEPAFGPGAPTVLREFANWDPSTELNIGPPTCCNLYRFTGADAREILLYVRIYFYSYGSKSSLATRSRTYSAEISPVEKTSMRSCIDNSFFGEGVETFWSGSDNPKTSGAYCYRRINEQFKFRLTLDTRQPIIGWVETRIGQATIDQASSGNPLTPFRFRLEGQSLVVPAVRLRIPYSNSEERDKYCSTDLTFGKRFCDPSNRLWWHVSLAQPSVNGIDAVQVYSKLLALYPRIDSASHEYVAWTALFRQSDSRQLNSCSTSAKVYGAVGGNAMLIGSDLPQWNSQTQSIDFRVLSPHYRPDGTVASGVYEMQIDDAIARCLWGAQVTPQNVSLSIIDDNGQSKNAIASVGIANSMVYFRASGFSYSATTLRATQVRTSVAAPTGTPLKRLICSRNGVKKLFAIKTKKCPRGWIKI